MSRDIKPCYSKSVVNQAGENIRKNQFTDDDVNIIENWRASHNHILNSWQATLRNRSRDKDVVFAQRLKRRNTIFNKLQRQPEMKLARMHDIAGCRLIFRNTKELIEYRESLHKARMIHIRKKAEIVPYPYNYIATPPKSGYRGIHDVYEYCARHNRSNTWNGLLVEIQYRTIFQHAWATAVEVAGSLTGNHSKFDQGDLGHKEFFRLSSEIIARAFENSKSCKAAYTNAELIESFTQLEDEIKLLRALDNLSVLSTQTHFKGKNVILIFSEQGKDKYGVRVATFDSLPKATEMYFEYEKIYSGDDIVLVRAESLESIRNAFRNYFSDAQDFVRLVKRGVSKLKK
jgi:ppGpp synthetase/RelA/SpoT-type nucleotidyltranferase